MKRLGLRCYEKRDSTVGERLGDLLGSFDGTSIIEEELVAK
jgi:hypothetical protein